MRRAVFYVPGFDPRGPGAYHRLYADNAALRSGQGGVRIAVGSRRPTGVHGPGEHGAGEHRAGWRVEAEWPEGAAVADYTVLRWDDLVRAAWPRGAARLWRDIPRRLASLSRSGVLARLRRGSRPSFLAAVFPALALSGFGLAVLAIGAMFTVLAAALAPAGFGGWLIAGSWLALGAAIPAAWSEADRRLNVTWLNHSIGYMVERAAGRLEDGPRWAGFAESIGRALDDPDIDEVLLVGHSQGAVHAVRLAARVLRAAPETIGRDRPKGWRLALVTLGQPLAIYCGLPEDAAIKGDLAMLSSDERLIWLDATMPSDAASSGWLDPLSGVSRADGARWPVRRSPRFHTLMPTAAFRALRRDPLAFHFQYLAAAPRVVAEGAYDFLRLTAGPEALDEQPFFRADPASLDSGGGR